MIVTIRLIKSFEFRTCKNLIMDIKEPISTITVKQFKDMIQAEIKNKGLKVYVRNNFDTLKIYMKPHGSKTNNLIINVEHDDLAEQQYTMQDDKYLSDYGIDNEWEISFFNKEQYSKFKQNPEVKW